MDGGSGVGVDVYVWWSPGGVEKVVDNSGEECLLGRT